MAANQEAAKRILFGGEVVGVIDPAARPIRSMTASAQISYSSLRPNRQSSLISLRFLSKTDPLRWARFWDRLRAGFPYFRGTSLPGFMLSYTHMRDFLCFFVLLKLPFWIYSRSETKFRRKFFAKLSFKKAGKLFCLLFSPEK